MEPDMVIAYAAYPLFIALNLLLSLHAYHFFKSEDSLRWRLMGVNISYFIPTSIGQILYLAGATSVFVLGILHGGRYPEWSWRWTVTGALIESSFAIGHASNFAKFDQWAYPLTAIASLEIACVLIAPTIPRPDVRTYLTMGIIGFHAIWTLVISCTWDRGKDRAFRCMASLCQLLSALVMYYNTLAFVIIFCTSSIVVCTQQLMDYRRILQQAREAANSVDFELRPIRKYNILFMGKCIGRTTVMRELLGDWFVNPTVSSRSVGFNTFEPINRPNLVFVEVFPEVPLTRRRSDEIYGTRFMEDPHAIVLSIDVLIPSSLDYMNDVARCFRGIPILLVPERYVNGSWEIYHSQLPRMEKVSRQRGWLYGRMHELPNWFNRLSSLLPLASPLPRHRNPNIPQVHFNVPLQPERNPHIPQANVNVPVQPDRNPNIPHVHFNVPVQIDRPNTPHVHFDV
ncbi:hypothetical protein F4808DRAFT_474566 [Astrocystis sublimbata]|nr:hypothetical protein F4808DRAFT_474566 [Astrocystis sublimbata]